jgi:hypothetical protein
VDYIPEVNFYFHQYSDGVICWGLYAGDDETGQQYDEELGPFPDFQVIERALNAFVGLLAVADGLPAPSTIRLRTLPIPALDPLVRTPNRASAVFGAGWSRFDSAPDS